ncbi:MAG: hypothetical protein ACKO1Y_00395 [Actinomycetota bacterium]
MFIVAGTGRCGTRAICDALDRFTDHAVRHEPEPRLLAEAWRAHRGRWRWTPTYLRRLAGFRRADGTPVGESVRCAPLLGDIARVAPQSRVVVPFRAPDAYLRSAWGRGVMRRGDEWDRLRILPAEAANRAPVDQVLFHYAEVNRILADAAARLGPRALVVEVGDLDAVADAIVTFVGATVTDREAMAAFLATRPNAGPVDGWDAAPLPTPADDARAAADASYRRLRAAVGEHP